MHTSEKYVAIFIHRIATLLSGEQEWGWAKGSGYWSTTPSLPDEVHGNKEALNREVSLRLNLIKLWIFDSFWPMTVSYNSPNTFQFLIYLFLTVWSLRCCLDFSLVAANGGYSPDVVNGLLIAVASPIVEHGTLGCAGFNSRGMWAQ